MINEEFQTTYIEIRQIYSEKFRYVEDEKLLEIFKNYLSYFRSPILEVIMHNDISKLIMIAGQENFDENQTFKSCFLPNSDTHYTLLELCCYYGAVDCFKYLRTKFESIISSTCLSLSFIGGNKEIISECLKYKKPNEECMEYAIFSHNIDFVTYLFNEHNIKINADICRKYDNLQALFVYLDQTKSLNECLNVSVRFNILSFCEYLINHCANANTGALIEAVKLNNYNLIKFFISKGAQVNEIIDGNTALVTPCEYNYLETFITLINFGADPNIETSNGKTVLYRAIELGNYDIAEFLINYNYYHNNEVGDYCIRALLYAVKRNYSKIVEYLISNGVDVNLQDENGETALHIAAKLGFLKTVKVLMSHGAKTYIKDKNGKTAFVIAHQNSRVLELLLSHGTRNWMYETIKISLREGFIARIWNYEKINIREGFIGGLVFIADNIHKIIKQEAVFDIVDEEKICFILSKVDLNSKDFKALLSQCKSKYSQTKLYHLVRKFCRIH